VIEDLQGREVATIREKKLALRESMDVLRAGAASSLPLTEVKPPNATG
jgi:hypothetical protein